MQASAAQVSAVHEQALSARATAWLPGLAVMIFGLLMVIGVGFSQISAAHNATHDTRHAAGFPCH